jgi:hypothetical protein
MKNFDVDETGLFYCMDPNKSLTTSSDTTVIERHEMLCRDLNLVNHPFEYPNSVIPNSFPKRLSFSRNMSSIIKMFCVRALVNHKYMGSTS